MSRMLFLCTGNYYRSRFAEEYFNHRAGRSGSPWRADSMALGRDLSIYDNPGPISRFALAELERRGVRAAGAGRWPARVEESDFRRYRRVIALSRAEHEPMLQAHFPRQLDAVEFLEIGDVHLEAPADAIGRLAVELDEIVSNLPLASESTR
jgi:protein-tyrosine phosphatase